MKDKPEGTLRAAQWVLRLGVSMEFAGHGAICCMGSTTYALLLTNVLGIEASGSESLLMGIGILDLIVAVLVLVRPLRVVVAWAALWGMATALVRPLYGAPWVQFVERGANWAAPLALLLLRGWPRNRADWLR